MEVAWSTDRDIGLICVGLSSWSGRSTVPVSQLTSKTDNEVCGQTVVARCSAVAITRAVLGQFFVGERETWGSIDMNIFIHHGWQRQKEKYKLLNRYITAENGVNVIKNWGRPPPQKSPPCDCSALHDIEESKWTRRGQSGWAGGSARQYSTHSSRQFPLFCRLHLSTWHVKPHHTTPSPARAYVSTRWTSIVVVWVESIDYDGAVDRCRHCRCSGARRPMETSAEEWTEMSCSLDILYIFNHSEW